MKILVNTLAIIGGFWVACGLLLGAACLYGAWSRRRIRARHAVTQWPRADLTETIQRIDDSVFLLAAGVDPDHLAHRPYDHEREGL